MVTPTPFVFLLPHWGWNGGAVYFWGSTTLAVVVGGGRVVVGGSVEGSVVLSDKGQLYPEQDSDVMVVVGGRLVVVSVRGQL